MLRKHNPFSLRKAPISERVQLRSRGRLRRAMRRGIEQQRLLALQLLPLYLLLFMGAFCFAFSLPSRLGEDGQKNEYQGEKFNFVAPTLSSTSPSTEAPASKESISPPKLELKTAIAITETKPQLETAEAPKITFEMPEVMQTVNLTEEEYLLPEPEAKAKPSAKAEATQALASTKSAASAPSAPSTPLGASENKAEGRVSVSYKTAPAPPYPSRMRAAKVQGRVLVRISVDKEGKPTHVTITRSSGHEEFDDIALSWILNRWLFNPAQEAGNAIASVVTTEVKFEYH